MAETLKDYLLTLGFKVEKGEEARFKDAMSGAAKTAAAIAASMTAAAAAISATVLKIASDFDALYFAAQRSNATVASIKSLSYALSQVGGSSGQAAAAIEGVASAIRTNPGIEGLLNSLGVATRENGKLKDTASIIDGIMAALKDKPYYVSAQIAGVLGLDEKTFQILTEQWPKIKEFQEEYNRQAKAMGVDPDKAAESSNKLMTSFRQLQTTVSLTLDKIITDLQPVLSRYLTEFGQWVQDHSEEIKAAILAIVKAVSGLATDLAELARKLAPIADDFGAITKAIMGDNGLKYALEALVAINIGAWLLRFATGLAAINPALAVAVAALAYGYSMSGPGLNEALVNPQPIPGDFNGLGIAPTPEGGSTLGKLWGKYGYGGSYWSGEKSEEKVPPREGLAPVRSKNGSTAWVDKKYQAQFQGFIDDLEKQGYQIDDLQGFADRANVNNPGKKSKHAFGQAIDINPSKNPNGTTTTDLPPNTPELAKKWGLGWGMQWRSNKDPMHFSVSPEEGGRAMSPEEVEALRKKQSFLMGQGGNQYALMPGTSRSVSISQQTQVNIQGSKDPAGTADAVTSVQQRVNADLLMNGKSAFA